MQKIKFVDCKHGEITIKTTVIGAKRTLNLQGKPDVIVFDEYLQVGCMRFSHEVVRVMHGLSMAGKPGKTYQVGDYKTKDSNTERKS